ncbi:Uncharacterised protein [Candidatus Burarchaeum australiense]|nr:Uncharacterised protein [Candidatus Burarchaeum australiense]
MAMNSMKPVDRGGKNAGGRPGITLIANAGPREGREEPTTATRARTSSRALTRAQKAESDEKREESRKGKKDEITTAEFWTGVGLFIGTTVLMRLIAIPNIGEYGYGAIGDAITTGFASLAAGAGTAMLYLMSRHPSEGP